MIDKIEFGKTGHKSTRTLFGAAALGKVTQKEADATLDLLLEYGVNHIDTAARYGAAEDRIKPWFCSHRDKFFLATKSAERTRKGAFNELQTSLKRMAVDHIDLWQFHCLIDQSEWDTLMAKGGALEAAVEAREKGLISYIGVTAHDYIAPSMHLKSLERFDFDSVLLPFNYLMMKDEKYRREFNQLRELCDRRGIALQTIKSLARRNLTEEEKRGATWYKPISEEEDIFKAVNWVLGHDNLFLNTTGDIHILPMVLKAASHFAAKTEDSLMEEMMDRLQVRSIF